MDFERRLMISRALRGEWSPRRVLHGFVHAAKNSGSTMVLIGNLLEIKKQAVSQWLLPIDKPASHVERHALDHLLKLAQLPESDTPLIIEPLLSQIRSILSAVQSMEPVPEMVIETQDEEEFKTTQIWAPTVVIEHFDHVAKQNFGSKRQFFTWSVERFLHRGSYLCRGFVFSNPKQMKEEGVAGDRLYVQLPKELNTRFRIAAKEAKASYNAFLLAAVRSALNCIERGNRE